GDDHVRHARAHDQEHRGVGGDVAGVGRREEVGRVDQREDEDQRDQDQPDPRARAGDQRLPPRAALLLRGLLDLRFPHLAGHRPSSSWKVLAPVMAATMSSIETSFGRRRATRWPSRSTSMRSATSKTSGMLWLISTTDRPCWRTFLICSSTLRVCTTPSAAVGSSMNTTLFAHVTARQMAMPW